MEEWFLMFSQHRCPGNARFSFQEALFAHEQTSENFASEQLHDCTIFFNAAHQQGHSHLSESSAHFVIVSFLISVTHFRPLGSISVLISFLVLDPKPFLGTVVLSICPHLLCVCAMFTGAIKAKVKAPRLQGRSVGLFATRTPHRPCNLGLSVAVIDKVCLRLPSGVNHGSATQCRTPGRHFKE